MTFDYPLPRKLSGYRPVRLLDAVGGQADLVLVRDAQGKQFVVKHYHAGPPIDEEIYRRLDRLRHPAIIRIHRHDTEDGRAYELLDYFPKGSLADQWKHSPMPVQDLTKLVRHLTDGISALHNAQIWHRDLKPGNLLIRNSLTDPVITDFGISESGGATRKVSGAYATDHYMPPEVLTDVLSGDADWWALGMIVLELAVGRHPFAGLPSVHVHARLYGWQPDDQVSGVSKRLRPLCTGLLAKDRKRRWSEPEIRSWLAGSPAAAEVPRSTPVTRRVTAPRLEPSTIPAAPTAPADPPAPALTFGNKQHTTKKSLADSIRKNWAEARKLFPDAGEPNVSLMQWLRRFGEPVPIIDRSLTADLKVLQLLVWLDPNGRPTYKDLHVSVAQLSEACLSVAQLGRPPNRYWGKVIADEQILALLSGFTSLKKLNRLNRLCTQWRDLPNELGLSRRNPGEVRHLLLLVLLEREKQLWELSQRQSQPSAKNLPEYGALLEAAGTADPLLPHVVRIVHGSQAISLMQQQRAHRQEQQQAQDRRQEGQRLEVQRQRWERSPERWELTAKIQEWEESEALRLSVRGRLTALQRHAGWTLAWFAPITALALYAGSLLGLSIQGTLAAVAVYFVVHLCRGGYVAWRLSTAYHPPFPQVREWKNARSPKRPKLRWGPLLLAATCTPFLGWLAAVSFPSALDQLGRDSVDEVFTLVLFGLVVLGNAAVAYTFSRQTATWDGRFRNGRKEHEATRRELKRRAAKFSG